MGAVFSEGLTDTEARIATVIGSAVGHWIYLADAADDFEEDRHRGRFNPYLHLFGNEPADTDWENLRLALTAQLCRAESAFLLIDQYPAPELKEILSNILYLGLPQIGKRITEKNASLESKKETSAHERS